VLLRPAAVAVHDDGDVLRQRRAGFGAQMWNGTHFACRRLRGSSRRSKAKAELHDFKNEI
jgi:hypothetical protein